jgi:zinc transport system ATP-binding protein
MSTAMPDSDIPALELRDIQLKFDGHEILKDIDLTVEDGEFLGIIGPNGGGKTTLLKVILGLTRPDSGSVRIYGLPPDRAHHLVGYVPQYSNFDPKFPIGVWDVVLMGRLAGMGRRMFFSREDKRIAMEALKRVKMEDYRHRQISQLSGGQQQRVLIARALAMKPRIILLDEPTASIDRKMEESIYELLNELNETVTIILVTHDVGILSAYVKKVGCLNKYFIYHDDRELTPEMLEAAYECPVDVIAHGVPHRVFSHEMPEGGDE